jgi:hypothetical protein
VEGCKLQSEEPNTLYCSPNIIRVIEWRVGFVNDICSTPWKSKSLCGRDHFMDLSVYGGYWIKMHLEERWWEGAKGLTDPGGS